MHLVIPHNTWEFVVAATIIILVPGPSVLFTVARAIAWGRATAIATVVGNDIATFLMAVAVGLGLGPVLQNSTIAFHGIQWFGGAYLVYLGISAIRESSSHAEDMKTVTEAKPSIAKTIRQGFTVGILNPKTLVFFAAILPQFTDPGRGNLSMQLMFLGLIFVVIALISDSAWGILAGTFRDWLSTDIKRLITLRRIGGTVMILLGLFTILNSLRS